MSEERTGYLGSELRVTLTERQRDVLTFLASWAQDHQLPPTFQEIATGVGVASISTISSHLDALERAGAIHRDLGRRRSIQLLPGAAAHLDGTMLERLVEAAIVTRIRAIRPTSDTEAGRLAHRRAIEEIARTIGVRLPTGATP